MDVGVQDSELLRCTIPKKLRIATWNTCKPESWSLSQCLEFFELSDLSQRAVFSAVYPLEAKKGAAIAREYIIGRLQLLIHHFQDQAQLAGLPECPPDTPYPELYRPIGQMSVNALIERLDRAQTYYQNKVAPHEEYAELKYAETLKFVILYSLERRLSFLFADWETQLEHLPHLMRFVKANRALFSIPEKPKLKPFVPDNPDLQAFLTAMSFQQLPSKDGQSGENMEEKNVEETIEVAPRAKTVSLIQDFKAENIVIPEGLRKKKVAIPENNSLN